MATSKRLFLVSALVVLIVVANFDLGQAAPTKARVNLRNCKGCKSIGTQCCKIITTLAKGTQVTPQCSFRGEVVNRNPYWLYVYVPSLKKYGWVSDHFVNCGGKLCTNKSCLRARRLL